MPARAIVRPITRSIVRAIGSQQEAEAPIITADTSPTLGPLDSDDTPADGYTAGTYSSTAGTISSAVATYFVNGSEAASSTDLETGDVVYVSVLVTDSEGNTRTFTTGSVTVTEAVADTIAPLLADLVVDGSTVSFTTDEGGTVYRVVDSTASYADADALIAAIPSADLSDSFTAAAGEVSQDLDVSGLPNGDYTLHIGMKDAAGNASNVLSEPLTIAIPAAVIASDPDQLFRWDETSVAATGGSVTGISDLSGGGYHLDTIPTGGAAPSFDGAKVSFDGVSQCIVSSVTGPIQPVLAGGGSVAIFQVVDLFSPAGSGESLNGFRKSFSETSAAGSANNSTSIDHSMTSTTTSYRAVSRRFSAAFAGTANAAFTKSVFCLVITQTTWTMYLDGVEVGTGAVTTGNLPNLPGYIALGASATPSGIGSLSALKGDVYAQYVTTNVTSGHIDAATAELAATYGITLP